MNDELLYFERERENLLLVEPSFVDNGIAELYQYLVAKKKKYALGKQLLTAHP
jgi:hypothetical protein